MTPPSDRSARAFATLATAIGITIGVAPEALHAQRAGQPPTAEQDKGLQQKKGVQQKGAVQHKGAIQPKAAIQTKGVSHLDAQQLKAQQLKAQQLKAQQGKQNAKPPASLDRED